MSLPNASLLASLAERTRGLKCYSTRPTGLFLKDIQARCVRRVHYYRRGSADTAMTEANTDRAASAAQKHHSVRSNHRTRSRPAAIVRAVVRKATHHSVTLVLDLKLRAESGWTKSVASAMRPALPAVGRLVIGADEAAGLFGVTRPPPIATATRAAVCCESLSMARRTGPRGSTRRERFSISHPWRGHASISSGRASVHRIPSDRQMLRRHGGCRSPEWPKFCNEALRAPHCALASHWLDERKECSSVLPGRSVCRV